MKVARLVLQAIGAFTVVALIAAAVAFPNLGGWLKYQDEPAKADFIFPLAGNDNRIIKAVSLYKQGFAPTILLSKERVSDPSPLQRIAEEMGYPRINRKEFRTRLIEHLGVPESATEWFGADLYSTAEEAEALKRLLGTRSAKIILVTSPYQARRAKIIFEHEMPQIQWLIVWPDERARPRPWWADQDTALSTLTELAKLLHYLAGGVFRGST